MKLLSQEKIRQITDYYDGGVPLHIIADIMDMSLHKVIDILFWIKVASKQVIKI